MLAASLASISYTAGLLLKSEDGARADAQHGDGSADAAVGIMLPMALAPAWLNGVSRATRFRYIIDAMRDAFQGHYTTTVMLEGVLVAAALTAVCLFFGARAFQRENA